MIKTFKVVGLTRPASFTLYEQNDHCWAKSGLDGKEFDELFRKADNTDDFWKQDVTATVECDGVCLHGAPINGVVTQVSVNSVPFLYRVSN